MVDTASPGRADERHVVDELLAQVSATGCVLDDVLRRATVPEAEAEGGQRRHESGADTTLADLVESAIASNQVLRARLARLASGYGERQNEHSRLLHIVKNKIGAILTLSELLVTARHQSNLFDAAQTEQALLTIHEAARDMQDLLSRLSILYLDGDPVEGAGGDA